MKIAYFTSAQNSKDFDQFQTKWTLPLNTSSQIFHNRLIRALALTNEMKVFVSRPFDKNNCIQQSFQETVREEKNITWKYLPIEKSKFITFFKQRFSVISKRNRDNKPDVIIVDCMNANCLSLAFLYSTICKVPVVGVVDDNRKFVSDVTPFKAKLISSLGKKCKGYICITKALNELVNTKNKPNIQVDCVTEDVFREIDVDFRKYKKYFFYSGALSERYGIYSLIEAFKSLNRKDVSLVICGYAKELKFDEMIDGYPNIFYLGTLPSEICLAYESNSIANINPKSYDQELDKYAVPSKTIEYLSATSLTISSFIEDLYQDFKYEALWLTDNYSLEDAMKDALNMKQKQREEMIINANMTANSKYSLKANNKKIEKFLNTLIR